MIADANVLSEIRRSWRGVEILRTKLQASAFASVGVLGGRFPFDLANAAHNVPFIHAYSVLNEVLIQLAKEGHFQCKARFLGELMERSEKALTWQDYSLVHEGVTRRNDVAHRGKLLSRGDCWKYVDGVKVELLGWAVIDGEQSPPLLGGP